MKRKPLVLDVRDKFGLRGFAVTLPPFEEQGYYLGEITLNEFHFHVEAIEVTETEIPGVGGVLIEAVNSIFQNRIDRFDDGEVPSLVKVGRKKFFITIQPFAQ
jgi:hypothetical protein